QVRKGESARRGVGGHRAPTMCELCRPCRADRVAREVVEYVAAHVDAVQPATDHSDENDEKDGEEGGKPIRPEASIQGFKSTVLRDSASPPDPTVPRARQPYAQSRN